MDEINDDFDSTDVALVIGASDTVQHISYSAGGLGRGGKWWSGVEWGGVGWRFVNKVVRVARRVKYVLATTTASLPALLPTQDN